MKHSYDKNKMSLDRATNMIISFEHVVKKAFSVNNNIMAADKQTVSYFEFVLERHNQVK